MSLATPQKDARALPAPIVERPELELVGRQDKFTVRRIYCVGRNYLEHIREMKEGDERDPPFFFQKPTDSLVTDGQVPYPSLTSDFQYELELVVALGGSGTDLTAENALDIVLGYAVGLDMTRRDRQRESFHKGLPWEIGKGFDFSAPCGPVHPVEAVGHILSGPLELRVNGEVKQQSVLEKMIWNVPEIVAQLSKQYRLMPGDLIFTGTPAGVSAVVPGDRLTATIGGLAPLEVHVIPSI